MILAQTENLMWRFPSEDRYPSDDDHQIIMRVNTPADGQVTTGPGSGPEATACSHATDELLH